LKYYRTLLSGPTLQGTINADILNGDTAGTVFEYEADAVWGGAWAQNAGDPGNAGTMQAINIQGYGRSNDIFIGKTGVHNTLVLNDGKNALFLDDPYSANGQMARIQNVQEIVAGDGGQIIDLTSTRFKLGNVTMLGGAGDDVLWSSAGHDSMNGLGGNDNMWGGSGNDTMAGGIGIDKVQGGAGNDIVRGGQSDDVVSGGTGADKVHGDTGHDNIAGDDGNDTVSGGDGNDTASGGNHNDVVSGGKGRDILTGNDGNDTMSGNTENDQVDGGRGDDRLYGNEGHDTVLGGDGNDRLEGWTGNDNLSGGAGADTLTGGKGFDVMTGGANADTFVWQAGDNWIAATETSYFDRITDFGTGDKLDFSALINNGAATNAALFVKFADSAAGTMVWVKNSLTDAYHQTVFLEGVHGLSVAQAEADGILLI
jgi:Ca2+-binding RTX toxin-like protein